MKRIVVVLSIVMVLIRTLVLSGSDPAESATTSSLQNNLSVKPAPAATALQLHSVLPPKVLQYLKDPKATFDFARVPEIRSAGMLELVRGFRAATNLPAKFRHAVVLSRYGNEQTVAMLANTLTNEFSGRQLTKAEAFDLAGIAAGMASLAERYDSAVSFLVSGCDPVFWERHKQWVSPNGDYYDIYLMTDMCLRGLAHSGRPEARTVLQEFRNGQRDPSKYNLAGAVMSAAYEYYETQQRRTGTQTTSRASTDIYAIMREFMRWRDESPDGREWRAWAKRFDGMTNQVQTGFPSPGSTTPMPESK
jgi:hypothetical protein